MRNLLQLRPHLDDRISQHPRIQPQCPSNHMLRLRAAVKAEDEVVALVVESTTCFADGFRQKEGSPVGDAADNAARVEDESAC